MSNAGRWSSDVVISAMRSAAVAAALLLGLGGPAMAQVGGTTNGLPASGGQSTSPTTQPGMPPTYPQMRGTGHRGGQAANAATAGSTVAGTHTGQEQLWSATKRGSSGAAEDARRGANTRR